MSEEDPPLSWPTFKRLLGYLKHYKLAFFVAVFCNLIYAGMDFLFVRSLEPLTDEALVAENLSILKIAPFFIIGILLVRGIVSFISAYCMSWIGQNIIRKMRVQMIEHFINLPNRFFDQQSSGDLVSKITFNTQQVASATTDALTKLLREGGLIIYILFYLFSTSWKLTSLFLLATPLIASIVSFASKRFRKIGGNIQYAMGGITQNTQEIIDGYKIIKTFGGEDYELQRFSVSAKKNQRQNIKMVITKAISVPLIQLMAGFSFALVLYFAGQELANKTLTAGQFVTMLSMMMMMLKPLKTIANLNSVIQLGVVAAQSVFELLDQAKENNKGRQIIESPQGEIEFSNVSFCYTANNNTALNRVAFKLNAGKSIAIVGRSGSGKSTLINCLLRFYDPDQGEIRLDGNNISNLELKNFRKHFSLVSQQVILFDASIAENIAYPGCETIDFERVEEAARKAHAWEFIQHLPDGLKQKIGENGQKLSGGQRQRIAIARALYKNAAIVILDEATSSLDSESERHIQQALQSLTENKTTLVIAHRLSTIEKADCILVMEQGEIVERGDHLTLLAQEGCYAKLYLTQFKNLPPVQHSPEQHDFGQHGLDQHGLDQHGFDQQNEQ